MDDLEQALRTALQREPAPEYLAGRILSRVGQESIATLPWWRMPRVRWATAVALAACVTVGVLEREREQRLRGEQARQQVLLALRITGSKLRGVQRQVVQQFSDSNASDSNERGRQ